MSAPSPPHVHRCSVCAMTGHRLETCPRKATWDAAREAAGEGAAELLIERARSCASLHAPDAVGALVELMTCDLGDMPRNAAARLQAAKELLRFAAAAEETADRAVRSPGMSVSKTDYETVLRVAAQVLERPDVGEVH